MYLFLHFYQESQLDYSTCVLTQKSTKSSLTLIKNRHKLHVQTGVPVPKVKFPRVRVAWFTADWAPKQNEAFEPGGLQYEELACTGFRRLTRKIEVFLGAGDYELWGGLIHPD